MRRADRLFQIIQILRREKGLTTGAALAAELEVSVRTIYRDIADLMSTGVPIDGEAGLGYMLREGYAMPPLMFTVDEIDSIVLGARIVESWADADLAKAARDVLAKISAVVPDHLRDLVFSGDFTAPPDHKQVPVRVDMKMLRGAIRARRKLHLDYRDEQERPTQRVIRPLTLSFYGPVWLIVGWCELRTDFRAFRADRIVEATLLDDTFRLEPGKTLADYLKREGGTRW